MQITKMEGNGQAQCKGCKDKGKWNVQWCCFLYKIEGKEGCYCSKCVYEIEAKMNLERAVRERANSD